MFKQDIKSNWFVILSLMLLLVVVQVMAESDQDNLDKEWGKIEQHIQNQFDTFEKSENEKWENVKKRVMLKWSEPEVSEVKKYVEYFDDDTARIKVDYEKGSVTVQALVSEDEPKAREEAQGKIEKIIKKAFEPTESEPPILLKEDVTPELDAKKIAKEVTTALNVEEGRDRKRRNEFQVSFNLVPDFVRKRAAKVYPVVKFWADKYKLEPALILAIIRQESAFNPRARSWVPAFGLMQIVPKYAGKEVMLAVTKKEIVPDSDFLFDPERNIMLGTTYLQILRDQYFANINEEAKRTFLLVASYNWGPTRVQNLIGKGRLPATSGADETYKNLREMTP
ncbi:MAG: DUF3393 domain-containing protein, partial [Proteobacteria bacterium]|nr:DUF3393 domain-containing protein [Pseudomonadota bacterium]